MPRSTPGQPVVAIAWVPFQPRTQALAEAFKGEARFVHGSRLGSTKWLLPLRYIGDAIETWRFLSRRRPRIVIAITPPVFAPLVAWMWCSLNGANFVMDCHTTAFHSGKWGWALPIHRWLARASTAVTLHTKPATQEVAGWRAPALFLPDDVPHVGLAEACSPSAAQRVVVAGSLDGQEPVEETIEAARMLPDVEVVLTGDVNRVPLAVRERAPKNVIFSGWLAYPRFLGELKSANVVAAFSLDAGIMNRAAFEAVGMGKALVLSDIPGLRERFDTAAVYSPNQRTAMADAISTALAKQAELEQHSRLICERLKADHKDGLRGLSKLLEHDFK